MNNKSHKYAQDSIMYMSQDDIKVKHIPDAEVLELFLL